MRRRSDALAPIKRDHHDEVVMAKKEEYFDSSSNYRESEAVCPKGILLEFIARMNRDLVKSGG